MFKPFLLAGLMLLTAGPVWANPITYAVQQDMHSANEASFTSKASIVKFMGRTTKISGEAKLDPQNVSKASGRVVVDLNSLDTGIELRNEHMRGTLESAKFPEAIFEFTEVKVPGNKLVPNQPVSGTAKGTMTIHGVKKALTAPVEMTLLPEEDPKYRAGNWVHVASQFRIKMTDYGITLPKGVLGIKVADDLLIAIDGMAKAR
jgi:polyisoprenoid-binding protein YceI